MKKIKHLTMITSIILLLSVLLFGILNKYLITFSYRFVLNILNLIIMIGSMVILLSLNYIKNHHLINHISSIKDILNNQIFLYVLYQLLYGTYILGSILFIFGLTNYGMTCIIIATIETICYIIVYYILKPQISSNHFLS